MKRAKKMYIRVVSSSSSLFQKNFVALQGYIPIFYSIQYDDDDAYRTSSSFGYHHHHYQQPLSAKMAAIRVLKNANIVVGKTNQTTLLFSLFNDDHDQLMIIMDIERERDSQWIFFWWPYGRGTRIHTAHIVSVTHTAQMGVK